MNKDFIKSKLMSVQSDYYDDKSINAYIDFCILNHDSNIICGENHHILSRTIFPEYQNFKEYSWNLSRLSNYNHYIAHAILFKAINHITFGYSWYAMNNKNFILEKDKPIELIGPDMYEELRIKRNKLCSEHNSCKVIAKDLTTGQTIKVTKEEFDSNINLVGHTTGIGGDHLKGTISVIDECGNSKRIKLDSEEYLSGNFKGHTTGKTTFKDRGGNTIMCYVDDHRVTSGELVGINKGVSKSAEAKEKFRIKRKGMRPSALKLIIFNADDQPMFYTDGTYREFAKINKLPNLLYNTLKENSRLDMVGYMEKCPKSIISRMQKHMKYHGWYIRKVKRIKI